MNRNEIENKIKKLLLNITKYKIIKIKSILYR